MERGEGSSGRPPAPAEGLRGRGRLEIVAADPARAEARPTQVGPGRGVPCKGPGTSPYATRCLLAGWAAGIQFGLRSRPITTSKQSVSRAWALTWQREDDRKEVRIGCLSARRSRNGRHRDHTSALRTRCGKGSFYTLDRSSAFVFVWHEGRGSVEVRRPLPRVTNPLDRPLP